MLGLSFDDVIWKCLGSVTLWEDACHGTWVNLNYMAAES